MIHKIFKDIYYYYESQYFQKKPWKDEKTTILIDVSTMNNKKK